MNKKHLLTLSLIISMTGIFSTQVFAQEHISQAPAANEPDPMPGDGAINRVPAQEAPAQAPAEPVTGYKGMLPYAQENAAIRKEAARKYGSNHSRKKSKKSKSKQAKSGSKKKSRSSASIKKSGTKKSKAKKKKSHSSH